MTKVLISTGIIIALLVGGVLFFQKEEEPAPPNTSAGIGESESGTGIAAEDETPQEFGEEVDPKAEFIVAVIKTDRGNIKLNLYPKIAPKTVENFVKLSNQGFYYLTKFHRVIPGFVIQGGDPLSKTDDPGVGSGGPGYTFKDEINPRSLGLREDVTKQLEENGYVYDYSLESLPVGVGAIAMANSGPDTNGSQFFIVTEKAQPHLDGKHTVFGAVVEGMDAVRRIEQGDVIKGIVISD